MGNFEVLHTWGDASKDEEYSRLLARTQSLESQIAALKTPTGTAAQGKQGVPGPPGPPGVPGTGLFYAADASVPGGNTINNTASETPFITTFTVPVTANLSVNSTLWARLAGLYGIIAGAQSVRLRIKINGTTVLETGIIPITTGPYGPFGWVTDAFFTFSVVGSSGAAEANGIMSIANVAISNGSVSIDTTAPLVFTFTWQFANADPSNTVTLRSAFIRQIG